MAVLGDFVYLTQVLASGALAGPVLELGSYAHDPVRGNTKHVFSEARIPWEGADIVAGPGVDFVLDVLDAEAVRRVDRTWGSVLLFNLLEHVYDPGLALRNALNLVRPGGSLLVVSPAFWEIHDYPRDFWRPMPDFYLEFARRNGCEVLENDFCWIVGDQLMKVNGLMLDGRQKYIPSKRHGRESYGTLRYFWAKGVNMLFHTVARDWWFPRMGLGVTLRKASLPRI